jgi:hypothetical protein
MVAQAYSAAYLPPPRTSRYGEVPAANDSGWVLYAGTVLAIAGVVNVVYGLSAIGNSEFFDQGANYIVSDLETWGWLMLILGVAQAAAAFAIWNERPWGRLVGIASATLGAIGQFLFLQTEPLAGLALFAAYLLVLYALLRFGNLRTGRPH